MNAKISTIYRYPVKSMGGDAIQSCELGVRGIPGDRCWTVRDEERGGIKGGKRFPELMSMHAALSADPSEHERSPTVSITLPDGTKVRSDATETNDVLSNAVGSPVTLWPLVSAQDLEHYRRSPPPPGTDIERSMRDVFARTDEEALPDLSKFPPELLEFESPPGTYFDAYPLLVVTDSSLNSIQKADENIDFDVRRFRPNIVLASEDAGYAENAWAGRRARLGTAVLQFELPCPRCVMTTHGFDNVAQEPRVMRHLVQQNDGNLGIYASVAEPGVISGGDELQWLD